MKTIQDANALTRDASMQAEYSKTVYDRQVADAKAKFELENNQMKAKIAADAQNMSMVAGTS